MGMRGNALDGLGASIMTKYFNKTELVSMPLHGLSLSKAKKAKKKHYLCFNALARAKSINYVEAIGFEPEVSMPSHGLNLSL